MEDGVWAFFFSKKGERGLGFEDGERAWLVGLRKGVFYD